MSDQPVPFVYATDPCGAEDEGGKYSCELVGDHDGQHMDGFHHWGQRSDPLESHSTDVWREQFEIDRILAEDDDTPH